MKLIATLKKTKEIVVIVGFTQGVNFNPSAIYLCNNHLYYARLDEFEFVKEMF